eukprot:jgi/Mesvir1/16476/Mv10035-RA.1
MVGRIAHRSSRQQHAPGGSLGLPGPGGSGSNDSASSGPRRGGQSLKVFAGSALAIFILVLCTGSLLFSQRQDPSDVSAQLAAQLFQSGELASSLLQSSGKGRLGGSGSGSGGGGANGVAPRRQGTLAQLRMQHLAEASASKNARRPPPSPEDGNEDDDADDGDDDADNNRQREDGDGDDEDDKGGGGDSDSSKVNVKLADEWDSLIKASSLDSKTQPGGGVPGGGGSNSAGTGVRIKVGTVLGKSQGGTTAGGSSSSSQPSSSSNDNDGGGDGEDELGSTREVPDGGGGDDDDDDGNGASGVGGGGGSAGGGPRPPKTWFDRRTVRERLGDKYLNCAQFPKHPKVPDLSGLPVFTKLDTSEFVVHQGNFERLGKGPSANRTQRIRNAEMLPLDGSSALAKYTWGSCALVGNSGVLRLMQVGRSIDSHDVVIRVNVAPTAGYERRVGRKTTFRVFNRLWTRTYRNSGGVKKDTVLPLEREASVIVTRSTSQEFELLQTYLAETRPDVTVLYLNSRATSMSSPLLTGYRERLCKAGYGPYKGLNVPSSGLVAVMMLLRLCDSVTIYGFGVKGMGARTRAGPGVTFNYHYYRGVGSRHVGDDVHSFDTEEELLEQMGREGYVTFCTVKQHPGNSSTAPAGGAPSSSSSSNDGVGNGDGAAKSQMTSGGNIAGKDVVELGGEASTNNWSCGCQYEDLSKCMPLPKGAHDGDSDCEDSEEGGECERAQDVGGAWVGGDDTGGGGGKSGGRSRSKHHSSRGGQRGQHGRGRT